MDCRHRTSFAAVGTKRLDYADGRFPTFGSANCISWLATSTASTGCRGGETRLMIAS